MPRPSLVALARPSSKRRLRLTCMGTRKTNRYPCPCLPPQSLRAHYSTASERERAKSLDRYYHEIIKEPSKAPPTRTNPSPSTSDSLPKTEKEATIARARVVFGSRLAGPAERRRDLDSASVRIAGVLVPPRPDEPDNCCMSGCVNCVWDRYRDELEEWAEKSSQAREALQAQRDREQQERVRTRGSSDAPNSEKQNMPTHVASGTNNDGVGSKSPQTGPDDLFAGVPIGIREFMRTEKKLKEQKKQKAKMKA